MKTDLKNIFEILVTFLIMSLLVLLFYSCGSSRKVEKQTTKEQTKSEISTSEKKDVSTTKESKIVVNEDTDEIEVSPVDNEKVVVINGKTYKNAKVKIVKRKTQSKTFVKETGKDLSKSKAKAVNAVKKQSETKHSKRVSNPFLPMLWLLIPLGVYLIWKHKYKIIGL